MKLCLTLILATAFEFSETQEQVLLVLSFLCLFHVSLSLSLSTLLVFFSPMCTTFDLRETPFRGKPDICMKQDIVLFAISGSRCLDVLDLLLSPVCFKLPFSMRRVTGLRSSKGESSSVRAEQYYS